MERFYRGLRAGAAPARALAAAKRDGLRSPFPQDRDSRAWAAFVLYGGA
jgi:CHAT domain-containing protein